MAEDVHKAPAAPTRRLTLDELVERDGQTVFELCTRLVTKHGPGLSRQAVCRHPAVLEAAEPVRARRQGRHESHDLNTEPPEHIATRWLRPDTPESAP
ncbi:helix-turn-helix transcriptional regulator [Streptomyces diastaticus]|uniref:ArsR family transcriptional regulator n=2 Tax=Streptomyces TaxID=1883 RepID=A0A380P5M3_STRGR|nr:MULTISPECIES: helix-turn-helix transcriptional regulator [Streptomyces]WSU34585.1 ArsR family transcriptional regulator [Streptomyces gougerotii]MBL3803185.1 helix-turn-helix transcriptional regulator [Streptomyces sp. BRB081]PJM84199.1 transcriptional regulator [Streptomyces sp. TSRI0384-2]QNE84292.1 transcriptional regulator [Streptomyces rutgersensis]RPK88180.1 hypothetical protein EES47_15135 [Streptomyces sp. ADI98-12]